MYFIVYKYMYIIYGFQLCFGLNCRRLILLDFKFGQTGLPRHLFFPRRPRQGLNPVARKGAGGSCAAARRRPWEPPQPGNSPPGHRGLPVKARSRPNYPTSSPFRDEHSLGG